MIEHGFDLAICILLAVTIVHLALVQRRLRAFRAERDRLQAFVTALDLTVERAELAIRRLKQAQSPGHEAAEPDVHQVRPRTSEQLLAAAGTTRTASAKTTDKRPDAAANARPEAIDPKGGLAALLRSVAGGKS
ncbi:MAG: hypothetical protein AAFX81_08215 [Pseudomonadota bacterium]